MAAIIRLGATTTNKTKQNTLVVCGKAVGYLTRTDKILARCLVGFRVAFWANSQSWFSYYVDVVMISHENLHKRISAMSTTAITKITGTFIDNMYDNFLIFFKFF